MAFTHWILITLCSVHYRSAAVECNAGTPICEDATGKVPSADTGALPFGSEMVEINLPGFTKIDKFMHEANVSSIGNNSMILAQKGCGSHPGLSHKASYCYWSGPVKQGEPDLMCVAMHPAKDIVSVSFEVGISPMKSYLFMGITVTPHAKCDGAVPMLPWWTGMTENEEGKTGPGDVSSGTLFHSHVAVTGKFLYEIGPMSEVKLTVECIGVMALYLGEKEPLAKPLAVMDSVSQFDTSELSDWGVLSITPFQFDVVLGPLSFTPAKFHGQFYVRSEAGKLPMISLVFQVDTTGFNTMAEMFPNIETAVGKLCKAMEKMSDKIKNSLLCQFNDKPHGMQFYADKNGAHFLLDWQDKSYTLGYTFSGIQLCAGEDCITGCNKDSQCPEGYQCCVSTLQYECQKILYSKIGNKKCPCAVSVGEALCEDTAEMGEADHSVTLVPWVYVVLQCILVGLVMP